MKLADILKIAAPLLAADKKPEDLEALIIAADKKGKDSLPGNVAEAKEIEDRKAKDRKARDEKIQKDRAARDSKRAADRAARDAKRASDRAARDRNDDPEHTNDMAACDAAMEKEAEDESKEEKEAEDEDYSDGDPSTPGGNRAGGKTAIDSAEVDARISKAVAARDALHTARVAAEPILGKVTFDSADEVYHAALKKLGVDSAGVTGDALPKMLQLAKDRATPAAPTSVALDSAGVSAIEKIIPGYGRLK